MKLSTLFYYRELTVSVRINFTCTTHTCILCIILFCDAFYIMIERCKMGVVYRVVLTVALMPMNTMSLFTVVPLLMSSISRVRVEVVVQNYTHAVEGTWAVN